ncbi:hypothetical protein Desgi_3884 [Desulfoscipio gibsoniae DSM 7213]|uniref:Transposase n=1 Tax=Desulfoscipio gibsoniae DSM 7213 TaxID=767817 RepID=R4KRI9_9FIRM|nr:hypothetical protein Desgi_3884 [Desulfoscipio gibsoniae DSM 7213]
MTIFFADTAASSVNMLWQSDLEARPVYVSREDHIQAFFLTCFIALVIARIHEMKLEHKYSIGQMLESLSKADCTHMKQNYLLSI